MEHVMDVSWMTHGKGNACVSESGSISLLLIVLPFCTVSLLNFAQKPALRANNAT
ncbi:hypothetical protein M434DRAFT_397374 [Hypoxylon sp. CO27-5]|nr:hypothetical protein M434DRAFT_397374 [Hypoxylon sp. CO27-5]